MGKICSKCNYDNDATSKFCSSCGAPLAVRIDSIPVAAPSGKGWFGRLPSLVQLLIGLGGIILIFVIPPLGIAAISTISGLASLLFLVGGFLLFRRMHTLPIGSTGLALLIGFYALMGMAIDQKGNPIYNAPLALFCPPGSSLNSSVSVSHPLPGRTDWTQRLECIDSSGNTVVGLSGLQLIAVRLVEYIAIGYMLFFISGIGTQKLTGSGTGDLKHVRQILAREKIYNDVRAKGVPAHATILSAEDMQISVGNKAVLMHFRVNVLPENGPPFEAETQGAIRMNARDKYEVGDTVWVKFNPADPTQVSLDHS